MARGAVRAELQGAHAAQQVWAGRTLVGRLRWVQVERAAQEVNSLVCLDVTGSQPGKGRQGDVHWCSRPSARGVDSLFVGMLRRRKIRSWNNLHTLYSQPLV